MGGRVETTKCGVEKNCFWCFLPGMLFVSALKDLESRWRSKLDRKRNTLTCHPISAFMQTRILPDSKHSCKGKAQGCKSICREKKKDMTK